MTLVPITLREARRFVAEHHRHNEPPRGHKYSIGLRVGDQLVGVVIASRPTARASDDGFTIEVVRLTVVGSNGHTCSRLYGAACRAAAAMGYRRAITYTLASEAGTSLRAAGFMPEATTTPGREWSPMAGLVRSGEKLRLFDEARMPTEAKVRWVRAL